MIERYRYGNPFKTEATVKKFRFSPEVLSRIFQSKKMAVLFYWICRNRPLFTDSVKVYVESIKEDGYT